MKIQRKGTEFQPIVITLETEEEVLNLLAVVGNINGKNKIRDTTDFIFDRLVNLGFDYCAKRHLINEPMRLTEPKED